MSGGLMLLARIAGQLVSLDAAAIETVIDVVDVTPVPRAGAGILGVTAVRSQVITVIDPAELRGQGAMVDATRAIVIQQNEHHYAVLVETVAEVIALTHSPEPITLPTGSMWDGIALSSIDTPYGLALVVDVLDLLPIPGGFARAA